MSVRIGKPTPDFRAQAYHKGDFTQINLSELRGRWVVLANWRPGQKTLGAAA